MSSRDGPYQSEVAREAAVAPLSIFLNDGEVVMATWRNLNIVVWGGFATLARARAFGRLSEQLVRSSPTGVSTIHLIAEGVSLPSGDARVELAEITKRYTPNLACFGTVLAGTGFATSAMRGYLTSLHFVQQRPYAARIFGTPRSLIEWLPAPHAARTGVTFTASALGDVLGRVTARVRVNK